MENKSTANKWLIVAVIVMGIVIVAMATWIIAGAVYKDKDSNSLVKPAKQRKTHLIHWKKLAVKARRRQMRQRKNIKTSEPKATARVFV